MIYFPNLLLIGGASRNVGKTTFSCSVINHFSKKTEIIGVKIKTVYKNDSFFHGKNNFPDGSDYQIIEEFDTESNEDTAKMLNNGAKRVFRIRTKIDFIEKAYLELIENIGYNSIIISESNSLRTSFQPGVFLLIKHLHLSEIKPSAKKMENLADKIIFSDGKNFDFSPENLKITNNGWKINLNNPIFS